MLLGQDRESGEVGKRQAQKFSSLGPLRRPISVLPILTTTPLPSIAHSSLHPPDQRHVDFSSPHQHRLVQARCRKGHYRGQDRPHRSHRPQPLFPIRFRRRGLLLRHPRCPHTRRCVGIPAFGRHGRHVCQSLLCESESDRDSDNDSGSCCIYCQRRQSAKLTTLAASRPGYSLTP